jgi:Ca-activated chloride channel family protein
VFYKAANEDVGATLLTHQPDPKKDGYFLMLVSPNRRAAERGAVPKDMVIVFDHSGSMSGKKLDQAKDAVRHVLKNLNTEDRFSVVAYNDAVEPFFSGLENVSEAKVSEALDRLDRVDAGGGTNIHEALTMAMKMLRGSKRPGYVIFMTDGLPTVGTTT